MSLLAYNKTTTAVVLAAGNPARTLPASSSPGVRGPAVNVTSELRGLSGGNYASLEAQRVAGTIDLEWTGDAEYETSGLTTGGPSGSEVRSAHVRVTAPLAAAADNIVAAIDPVADGALTIAAQPDVPRKLTLTIVDADASISAGIATIVSTGPSGESQTEVVSLTGGSAVKTTTKAHGKIASITVSGVVGAAAGDTLSVGVSAALGLPGRKTPLAAGFAVHKANVDQVDEAVGTVDATAGTIVPTTAPNGAKHFDFWYTYQG